MHSVAVIANKISCTREPNFSDFPLCLHTSLWSTLNDLKSLEYAFLCCVSEFIPCMDKLFDESILIGSGYTARETLR